ncbi:MAG: hypothetical protein A7315_02430 [Candidatus Altiarchaeales archaeon WOR_SM1_79]|nr:MAG: hypothetical protein A7315_02430 [Candidatus Altiarchaeales archaeon WOR_SM1_79]
MKDFLFQIPHRIEVGFSKSNEIVNIVKEMELKRILLVVDNKIKSIGLIDPIIQNLKDNDITFSIFDEIKSEPTISEVDQAIDYLNIASNFDVVIGIGGGSTIDVAKVIAISSSFSGSIKNYIGTDLIDKRGVSMIMVPTTSGTGAEVTPNAVVRDEEEECKKALVSPFLIPELVILDPELTISLPPKITAETGIDAFTHSVECFICNKSNAMSDLFALDSIRMISRNLRRAVENGNDREARYNMALASLYGGIAITNSGTGGVHALAYPLGGKYGLSHGLSNSILLADVIEFNAETVPEKFVRIANAMGIETIKLSQERVVSSALVEIRKLVDDVGIRVENFEVSEQVIDDLSKSAMSVQRLLKNNPRPIKYEDARRIYRRALLIK